MSSRAAGIQTLVTADPTSADPAARDANDRGKTAAAGEIRHERDGTAVMAGWFGDDRPLFGWVHLPVGRRARGGVVIFPPIGHDQRLAYPTLRALAGQLAAQGFLVVRFDYDGAGDSAGDPDDPDRINAWLRSGEDALRLVRGCGVTWIAGVGMRVGASLAAMVAERIQGVDALVLWDPLTGRAFLSEQRALARLSFGGTDQPDGAVEIPGLVLPSDTVEALRDVGISRTTGRLADRILCLTRSDRPSDKKLSKRLSGSNVEWAEAAGQEDVIDRPPPHRIVPERAMGVITTWLAGVSPAAMVPVRTPALRTQVWLDGGPNGLPVSERAIVTGTAGLSGIITEPLEPHGGPTVMLLNVSNDRRIGPNRLWVSLARRWAQEGFRSVRFDLSGLGDSGTWDGQDREVLRIPEHFDDVFEMAAHVSPEDPSDVVLIGLCSSAYQAIDSAFQLRPRGICAINPLFSFTVPELAAGEPMDSRRRVARHRTSVVAAFNRGHFLWPIMRRFPKALWFGRNLLSRQRPARWLEDLVEKDVVSFYMVSDYEARQLQSGSARTLNRLNAKGQLVLQIVPGLDHGLMSCTSRETVAEELTRHVHARFVGPSRRRLPIT
jgi:pimeloyl-ACP methyl ester carboxylesterase